MPNRIKKRLSNKKSAHHIRFDMTMHDIFLDFSKVKFNADAILFEENQCKKTVFYGFSGAFNEILVGIR